MNATANSLAKTQTNVYQFYFKTCEMLEKVAVVRTACGIHQSAMCHLSNVREPSNMARTLYSKCVSNTCTAPRQTDVNHK